MVTPSVPKSVLTQNPHPAPNKQQAEQVGLTREQIPEINKGVKQLDAKAWNLPSGTRQFHICG
jgi:hypothetical protein